MGVASSARRFANDPFGGETAVVPVEAEGIRSLRAGVENVDVNEPSEMSGTVPDDCADVSAWVFSAADIVAAVEGLSTSPRTTRGRLESLGVGQRGRSRWLSRNTTIQHMEPRAGSTA